MTSPSDFNKPTDWKLGLLLTPTKQPRALLANALAALRGAPEWSGVFAYDEFALVTMAQIPPPWCRGANNWTPRQWTDQDDAYATEWLQQQDIGVPLSVASKAVEAIAKDRGYHPIRDYLGGLEWDGVARVEGLATVYLGAEVSMYHATLSRCLLISAVARVMDPGCKVDHATILEGPQGAQKSTAIETMFHPWFSDDIGDLGSKDSAMQVRAAWCIELAELAAMQRGEIEKTKAFITRRTDRFRPPYNSRVIQVPRQSIFVGSTNADHYIKDETGGRRFWPLRCGTINIEALCRDKDQLWAEAVSLYCDNTPWWLEDADEIVTARSQQEERRVVDAWEEPIKKFIEGKDDVTIGEVLADVLFLEKAKWTQMDQNRVSRCLIALGWRRGWRGKERCYRLDRL